MSAFESEYDILAVHGKVVKAASTEIATMQPVLPRTTIIHHSSVPVELMNAIVAITGQ